MGDTDALRDKIAQAALDAICLTNCNHRISSGGMMTDWNTGRVSINHTQGGPCAVHRSLSAVLADAVLPVVQAHEKALCDAWMAVLKGEKKTALSELSSLRDAVAHLADELECAGISSADAYGQGVLLAQRDAARRLRSLLPQEGPTC